VGVAIRVVGALVEFGDLQLIKQGSNDARCGAKSHPFFVPISVRLLRAQNHIFHLEFVV
jgi:hypothetical protein